METSADKSKIQDQLLKRADVAKWDQLTFNEYFVFSDFFYEGGKIVATIERLQFVEQYQDASPFINEMLLRINRPSTMENWNKSQFYMRLSACLRIVKLAIQTYPKLLNPKTVREQRDKPQFEWLNEVYDKDGCVKQKEKEPTRMIGNIEVPTSIIPVQPTDTTPSGVLQEAMLRVANIYNTIADSISEDDIKKLNVKDRIGALQKLSYIHQTQKKMKPNLSFNKINIVKGGKEELEQALLSFDDDENE